MRNIEIAVAGLKRAERWLQAAKRALEDRRWDDVVYSAQMTVEQSVKAVLFALGIDFPREHDVSDVLYPIAERNDMPEWFREKTYTIADWVAELAEQRGLAGYGFEKGIDVEYFMEYAPEAFRRAEETHKACFRLLKELFRLP